MHNQIFQIAMFGGVKGNQKGIETKAQEVRGNEQCNYPLWKKYALWFFLGGGVGLGGGQSELNLDGLNGLCTLVKLNCLTENFQTALKWCILLHFEKETWHCHRICVWTKMS